MLKSFLNGRAVCSRISCCLSLATTCCAPMYEKSKINQPAINVRPILSNGELEDAVRAHILSENVIVQIRLHIGGEERCVTGRLLCAIAAELTAPCDFDALKMIEHRFGITLAKTGNQIGRAHV